MDSPPLLQYLYDVKAGITKFMQLLRQTSIITVEQVVGIVDPVKRVLTLIETETNAPIAQDMVKITRQTLAACVKVVKIYQHGGDIETAQMELQQIGAQFNAICREFADFAREEGCLMQDQTITTTTYQSSGGVGQFLLKYGLVNYVNREADFELVLTNAQDRYVCVNISNYQEPSTALKPVFEELAHKYPQAAFVLIDIDKPHDMNEFRVLTRFPHFQFYLKGQKLKEFSGPNENYLRNILAQYITPAAPTATTTATATTTTANPYYHSVPISTAVPASATATTSPTTPSAPAPPPVAVTPKSDFNFVPFKGSEKGCMIEVHNPMQYNKLLSNRSKVVVVGIMINSQVCYATKKVYTELCENNPHADFLLLDLDEMKSKLPDLHNVDRVPYFRFYKDGKMVKDLGGQFMEDALRAAVANVVTKERPKQTEHGAVSAGYNVPGTVFVITTDDAYKMVLGTPDILIIVNFYNHEKISQSMIPVFAQLASSFHNVVFASVDVNACKQSVRACSGATRLPAFRFFKNGAMLKDWQGNNSEYLEGLIKQYTKVK